MGIKEGHVVETCVPPHGGQRSQQQPPSRVTTSSELALLMSVCTALLSHPLKATTEAAVAEVWKRTATRQADQNTKLTVSKIS